jgi:S1-C subfamily serine protease
VESVVSESPAELSGIRTGDLISEMDFIPVNDVWLLKQRIAEIKAGSSVKIGLVKSGKVNQLDVVFAERPSEREIEQLVESSGRNFP